MSQMATSQTGINIQQLLDEVEQNIVICQWWALDQQVCFHILITSWQPRETICHFSLQNVVPIMHEQSIICSKTRLDGTTHDQTIICRQLFAGYMVDFQPTEGKKKRIER